MKMQEENCLMKWSLCTIIVFVLLLSSCGQFETGHQTDLAIDTYVPSKDALGLAEKRAKEYWVKHREQIGRDTRYLAVQSDTIFSDEIPDLYAKLINSPAVNASDLEDFGNDSELSMYCVNIFDTETEKLVSQEGYAVVDLPGRGKLARFGPYTARYIGSSS
jgi:hypothetical protein